MKDAKILTKIIHGSRLFGTAIEGQSDWDYKSVYLPSGKDILLGNSFGVKDSGSNKEKNQKNDKNSIDDSSYSLSKFLNLIVDGDTSAVEILLAPDQFRLETSDEFKLIQANKDKLLNRKSRGFAGYAKGQFIKFSAKGARMKSLEATIKLLESFEPKEKLGFYQNQLLEFVKNDKNSSFQSIITPSGSIIQHFVVCEKMSPFTVKVKDCIQPYKSMLDEYGHRAKSAVTNKYDLKSLSHAVRIAGELVELLQTGNLTFPRPDCKHLLDIKLGNFNYDEVSDSLDEVLSKLDSIVDQSVLPEISDIKIVQELIIEFHKDQIL